jgi:cytochrome P450
MFISIARNILFTFAFLALAGFIVWLWLRFWYFRLVSDARSQICDRNGREVPGSFPRMLVGNLVDVYSSSNHLSAYNSFHEQFGEIVQIFWMWRQQISISNYAMARQILVANQRNYEKFPPNSLIQRLFGKSVLTNSGDDWKRHRLLLNEVFSQKSIAGFHDIFVEYSERLVRKWDGYIDRSQESTKFDIYPEMLALFLDIVGKVSIGRDFAALEGEADDFLDRLKYIVQQSTRPLHQFTKCWKYLPLASNRKLESAFREIDDFLYTLIRQRKENGNSYSSNVLDLLLQAKNSPEANLQPLTDKEIRDNLLAIIVNGHETVAASVSFSLYLLARHPEKLARAQAEVDTIMERNGGKLSEAGLAALDYLNSVILETLRFCPPMAGLQRISSDRNRFGNL